ncbi:MAG: porin [Candidatus Binatia bacterium]
MLQDAYGDIKYFSFASLRAGKFKPPVSLERLQSGTDLTFIERSILQNLVPNRDVGLQLYGDFVDGSLGYQVGIFNGVFDTEAGRDVDLTDDKDFAGRVFTNPFKTTDIAPLKGLGFGLAGTYGHANGESIAGLAYKTGGRSNYFTYNADAKVVARGGHYRVVPQLYYYFGPFGLMGEYAVSKQTVEGTAGGAARADYDAKAFFVQASYVLTVEDNTFKSVSPINNFDPYQGRWGAFEIAARVANTELDDDPIDTKVTTFALGKGTDSAWAHTAGLNWYLNKNFKFQFNYERTDFAGHVAFGSKKLDHEDALLTRFQVSF